MTRDRYGRWAVVAGASEGLGAAFAESLAARGHDLILIARRADALVATRESIQRKHKVEVRTLACDLATDGFATALGDATEGLDVGVGVYNAAYSYMGPLLDRPLEETLRVIDVNCRGPVRFVHTLVPGMIGRGRGGIVLMASLAGLQGSPNLAAYAASKAFNIVLGQSLWKELRPKNIDVLVSCAGAISTPNYLKTMTKAAPGTCTPQEVAEGTIDALGSGPMYVPGAVNKIASFMLGRLVSRRRALAIMGSASREAS